MFAALGPGNVGSAPDLPSFELPEPLVAAAFPPGHWDHGIENAIFQLLVHQVVVSLGNYSMINKP